VDEILTEQGMLLCFFFMHIYEEFYDFVDYDLFNGMLCYCKYMYGSFTYGETCYFG
jgi:hypothetical protein